MRVEFAHQCIRQSPSLSLGENKICATYENGEVIYGSTHFQIPVKVHTVLRSWAAFQNGDSTVEVRNVTLLSPPDTPGSLLRPPAKE